MKIKGCTINAQNVENILLRKVMPYHTASPRSPGGAQYAQNISTTKRIPKGT